MSVTRRGRPARAIADWPVWRLPRRLTSFVVTVIAADLAAIGLAAHATQIRAHDLGIFGLLMLCTAASVELSRKAGEKGGMIKDVHGVWELPAAILLPPLFALIAPIPRIALLQWRVRRAPLYRRVFSCASIGLSLGAASVAYHRLAASAGAGPGGSVGHGLNWLLLMGCCALLQLALNKAMIMTAVKGADPAVSVRAEVFRREPLYNDFAELCIGVLVTYGVAGNPFLAPAALPVVILLQRSLRHAQLLSESRADAKTGLLNSATWEREAAAELARAVRAGAPLAVALLDLDRFKAINDTHGHLLGDQVLREIASTMTQVLRRCDLAGRFGGEEFVMLLPRTRSVDAFRIAERVRAHIAGLPIYAASGAERVTVTVSIGVAALDGGSRRDLGELLATADAALYSAKAAGRDQVQMISTTRGRSAVRPSSPDPEPAAGPARAPGPAPEAGPAPQAGPAAAAPAPQPAVGVAAEAGSASTASTSAVAV